jgi:bile acid:Na+ symporter, BASS family
MTLGEIIILAIKINIAGLVFGLGLRSRAEELLSLLERPSLLARSMLAMNLIMPAFAIVLVKLFDLRTEVAVALIALSLAPVPPLLPQKDAKAGGDRSFAISLLVIFAVFAVVWVPLAVQGVGLIFGRELGMSAGPIAWIVVTLILAPLLLGIVLRRYAAGFAQRIERPVSLVSNIALVLAGGLVVVSARSAILAQIGDGTILLLTAFILVGLAVGHVLGGPNTRERTDLALATSSRHPGIALAIASTTFPDTHAAKAVVALYLLINILIGLPYVRWRARRAAAVAGEGETP